MSTKSTIIFLVGLAIIVGAVLFVFRYEYVVVNQVNGGQSIVTYIVRFNRFTIDECYVRSDEIIDRASLNDMFLIKECEYSD